MGKVLIRRLGLYLTTARSRQSDGKRLLVGKGNSLPEKFWSPLTAGISGIAGIPGSGKSSVAYPLVDRINELAQEEVALCIGGDGWHYSQTQLRGMKVSVGIARPGRRL